jgi:hypothetical protein
MAVKPPQISHASTKEPQKNIGGRPKKGTYTEDRLLDVCNRVALGETLTAIAAEDGMPSPAAFRRAVMRTPELRDAWETAKSERPHSLFEQAIDLSRRLTNTEWETKDTNKVRAIQVAIDALRTAAARLAPRDYGERPATQVVVPVQINTNLGLDPAKPPSEHASIYQIEVAIPAMSEAKRSTDSNLLLTHSDEQSL